VCGLGGAVKRQPRPLAECDALIEARAVRFVRLHVAGRRPIPYSERREANVRRRDRALGLLIEAVEERDASFAAFTQTMDRWRVNSERATRAAETRRRNYPRHSSKEK
jgi:hypothetical protein